MNFPLEETRQLIKQAIPADLFVTYLPELYYLYVPESHIRALHPDNMLVEGIRGAGKSLWWKALQKDSHRQLVNTVLPQTHLAKTQCLAGFGGVKSDKYPDGRILQNLQAQFERSSDIWYAIVAFNLLSGEFDFPGTWSERIRWVQDNLEQVESALLQKDRELQAQDQMCLVLFDALDRAAQDWRALRKLLKGLLELLLEFRSYKAIRLKAFVRPDMLETEILAFPDSSKVLQNKVSLGWPRAELYSLLWQYLGNELEHGSMFRQVCQLKFSQTWTSSDDDVWLAPKAMRSDEALQRSIFDALAGKWMGKNAKRGYSYTWLPNHLGDSHAQVSPRSFLAALREAAEEPLRKEQAYPLHYEAIKKGVQKASSIRVDELSEDYPWVGILLAALKGTTLPCEFEGIASFWKAGQILEKLQQNENEDQDARRSPTRLDQGYPGLRDELIELGIFQTIKDGRIDMPDVYRVGYGLKRRGGVRPVR